MHEQQQPSHLYPTLFSCRPCSCTGSKLPSMRADKMDKYTNKGHINQRVNNKPDFAHVVFERILIKVWAIPYLYDMASPKFIASAGRSVDA